MQAVRVDSEMQPIVHIRAHAGLHRGHHRMRADSHIEQDLGAELFDDLDHRVKAKVGGIDARGDVDVFGPDSHCHLAADMPAEATGSLGRHFDAHTVVLRP